ncbi:hypothetical protein F4802DRAFT_620165 [Xylaria palmicola]|nr:hypothetical protein F4802DRAFT_620165 [Xylaria palmicola]
MESYRYSAAVDSFKPSFHLFTELPAELRLVIWALSLPESRIVTIRCDPGPAATQPDDGGTGAGGQGQGQGQGQDARPPLRCRSPAPVPAALQACRESRAEALRRYRLLFGAIYLDPERDALYFGARDGGPAGARANLAAFVALTSAADRAAVRLVAVNEALLRDHHHHHHHHHHHRRSEGATPTPTPMPMPAVPPQQVTEGVVGALRTRFGGLRRLALVCGDRNPVYSPDAVLVEPARRNRLIEGWVEAALGALAARNPSFVPPDWDVRAIAAGPRPILPGQEGQGQGEILCYRGARPSFLEPRPTGDRSGGESSTRPGCACAEEDAPPGARVYWCL